MPTNIAVKETETVARPLKVLVPLIEEEIERGEAARQAAGVEHFRRAGEYLLEAQAQVPRGEWDGWLKRNFHLSRTTAFDYMRLAKQSTVRLKPDFSTLSEAVGRSSSHPSSAGWDQPVREILNTRVNVERLAEERQDKNKELQLTRELALQLIDIGYKVLVTKLHPDKGGSSEAMTRLNRVRDILKRAV